MLDGFSLAKLGPGSASVTGRAFRVRGAVHAGLSGRWCTLVLVLVLVLALVRVAGRAFLSLPWLDSWPGLPELAARCNLHANALPCRKPSFIKPRPLQAPPAPSEKAVEP